MDGNSNVIKSLPGKCKLGVHALLLLSLGCLGFLPGCQMTSVPASSRATTTAGFAGHVHGGQQPVSGATIGFYAVGTTGVASAASPLLTETVLTDGSGNFNLNGLYNCPTPDTQVFLTATGGNPGVTQGVTNKNIALMAMLGPCSSLTATTFINMNEETTVSAIWPLASYISSPTNIGSNFGDPLFGDAVLQTQQLVDVAAGSAPGVSVPGYTVQVSKVNHLADILGACVNSSGGTAGDGSACGTLFATATPPNGIPPIDTVTAALRIAQHPTENVVNLFDQVSRVAPFQPTLTNPPSDWTLNMVPIPSAPTITPASGAYNEAQAVTIADATAGAVLHYTLDGTAPTTSSPVYTGPISVTATSDISAVAMLSGLSSTVTASELTIAGRPASVAFSRQPSSATAGAWISPAISVEILDSGGNLCTAASGTVTIMLPSQSSGSLAGTLTEPIVSGVATFADLSLSSAGTYTMVATSAGLTSAASASFSITAPSTTGEQATSALAFTDTVGMNLHLAYTNTLYYTNFPLVVSSLQDLGVHHVRDGLVDFGTGTSYFYTEYQQLAAQGIRGDYITSIGQSEALMQAYPSRVGGMEALEAPNEYDTSGDPNWAADLRAFLPVLQDAVHGAHPMTGITLYGPSLVNQNWTSATGNSYAQLGQVSKLFDSGNLHNYPGGRNPGTPGWTPQGYGSIAFAISSARQDWPTVPMVTTETGYWDDTATANYVPDSAMARYLPRVFLEQFLHGITRTYLYDLADTTLSGDSYGLLRTDGTQKPAYLSLQALMHLLADTGAAYTTGHLNWTMSGAQSDLHHLLLHARRHLFARLVDRGAVLGRECTGCAQCYTGTDHIDL